MTKKMRLDELLVARSLFPSLAQAQRAIMAGEVFVRETRVDKAGTMVAIDSAIKLHGKKHPYVSRGGLKLAGTLDAWGIIVSGCIAVDIGAATGGFTDCLLQRGARKVYALDVGKGLLDWKLRSDGRVVVGEGINIRHFDGAMLEEAIDIVVIDVAFISLKLVLPVAARTVRSGGTILALIKPQFEAPRENVGPGGVVTDAAVREAAIVEIVKFCQKNNELQVQGTHEAQPAGHDGNREFFLRCRKNSSEPQNLERHESSATGETTGGEG